MTTADLTTLLAPYELPPLARLYVYREPGGAMWYTRTPGIQTASSVPLGQVDTDSRACVVPDVED